MAAADDGGHLPLAALTVAAVSATIAFAVYTRTMLPGVDLGDTGGFQAAVLWPETSARRAYPLYYFLAKPFVIALSAADPARGLNLFSALCAGAAVGLLAYVAAVVAGSALAGAAAGLLLAFSYTFWTQALIAEVYALHLALIALCLIALHAYAARQTTTRLAAFFAVYGVSFGNHLGMILLLVPFAIFLLQVHPAWRDLVRPRIVALACVLAALGASLYVPNLLSVWTHIDAPPAWRDRLAAFWFDTTKADWREAMVLGVRGDFGNRLAMWLWDARQQFGLLGLVVALIGGIRLWRRARPWATLVGIGYAISTLFAVTYNVGDPHVFFLPGHFITAFVAAMAFAPWRAATRPVLAARLPITCAIGVLIYSGWRAWDNWPAVDRHADRRADALVARLATGVGESNAVLLSQMNWQSENVLLYSGRYERRTLAWTRLADVLPHLPFFIRDNHAIGRDVVLTTDAAAEVVAAFGPLYPIVPDPFPPAPPMSEVAARVPRGAPYVLVLLSPTREEPLDVTGFDEALVSLAGVGASRAPDQHYQIWAGVAGEPPVYDRAASRPFRDSFALLDERVTVRLDAWLPFDSFRRGGFGSVLRGRSRVLIIERGASLVWLDGDGSATVVYSGSLYAPKPRFRIPASLPQQARGIAGAILGTATLPR